MDKRTENWIAETLIHYGLAKEGAKALCGSEKGRRRTAVALVECNYCLNCIDNLVQAQMDKSGKLKASRPQKPRHNCERYAPPDFLTSGHRQPGERWTCPKCGTVWVHDCDEAEGCCWVPAKRQAAVPKKRVG
jgi:hypothetical protein